MSCSASRCGKRVPAGAPGKPREPKSLSLREVKELLQIPTLNSVPILFWCLSRELQVQKTFKKTYSFGIFNTFYFLLDYLWLNHSCLSSGPICASTTGPEPDKDRVTRMDIADVREVLNKQRREIETLQLVVDVDGNLVNEMKLLRKESRNMNSRVTQLYMQLLHEIIRKRDNSLELAQLENRVLNVTSEMMRLASRYKDLEARFATIAGVVNNQSVLITALEEQCLRSLGQGERAQAPPLVRAVPQNIPVDNRFTNEIQRNSRAFTRGSRKNSPTVSPFGIDPPPPQGTLTSDGTFLLLSSKTQNLFKFKHPQLHQCKNS